MSMTLSIHNISNVVMNDKKYDIISVYIAIKLKAIFYYLLLLINYLN